MKIEDLVSGNYYVYTKYGICQYVKPEVIKNYGVDKQFYTFYFKNKRQCFLVKDQIDKCIFFYADKDKEDVKLSNMDNNKSWKKRKQKTMLEISQTAKKLVNLSIERKSLKGYKYNTDHILNEFLRLLPFEMSEGQISAITDINKDLSNGKVMNRLVYGGCGA